MDTFELTGHEVVINKNPFSSPINVDVFTTLLRIKNPRLTKTIVVSRKTSSIAYISDRMGVGFLVENELNLVIRCSLYLRTKKKNNDEPELPYRGRLVLFGNELVNPVREKTLLNQYHSNFQGRMALGAKVSLYYTTWMEYVHIIGFSFNMSKSEPHGKIA